MRQVPVGRAPLGLIGDGRVARHVRHYCDLLDLPVRQWSRQSPVPNPVDTMAGCGTVLVLLPDGQIGPFVETWPGLRAHRLAHCSGSLVLPGVAAAHPLMTFGDHLYDLPAYTRIAFVLDEGGAPFDELFPGLPNSWFTIPAAQRPYYHALCVMAGNFSTLLWQKLFDECRARFGIPATAVQPYCEQWAANLLTDPARALTGPLVRNDAATLAANVAALEGDPFHGVYRACVEAYAHRL